MNEYKKVRRKSTHPQDVNADHVCFRSCSFFLRNKYDPATTAPTKTTEAMIVNATYNPLSFLVIVPASTSNPGCWLVTNELLIFLISWQVYLKINYVDYSL